MVRKTKIYTVNFQSRKTEVCVKTQCKADYDSQEIIDVHKSLTEEIIKLMSDRGCGYIQDFKIK